jgi:N-acetylneuraminic acid mutarotase
MSDPVGLALAQRLAVPAGATSRSKHPQNGGGLFPNHGAYGCPGTGSAQRFFGAGGYNSGTGLYTSWSYAFDDVSNTWTAKTSLPANRGQFMGSVVNDLFYAGGGTDGTDRADMWSYDIGANAWTARAAIPAAKRYTNLVAMSDDFLVTTAGVDSSEGSYGTKTYLYDRVANTWTTKTAYPLALYGPAGCEASDTTAIFSGGFNGSTTITNTYLFDRVANTWTAKAAAPGPHQLTSGTGRARLGKAIILYAAAVWIYDPAANTWETVSFSSPTPDWTNGWARGGYHDHLGRFFALSGNGQTIRFTLSGYTQARAKALRSWLAIQR